ncbi:BH3-interacting domain death agonist [Hyla sarda]|uniref:BH3-interacting domain death agonist n=1 Tax=Hyla sarda TaxID=327740 RepID=UPI0024C43A75|nr:BH3-interacting domain death agonist [Hyla sarda]
MSVELIFVAFLECQKTVDPEFKSELSSIKQSLHDEGDLQTDSHDVLPRHASLEPDGGPQPLVEEELCRRIGAQLAEMGDRFQQEGRIRQEVVESLVHDILSENLTEDRFRDAVSSLLENLPPGMDLEKATLVVAMTLTSKVGCSVPNLLQNCFTTALNFIDRNYRSYVQRLSRQV